MTEQDDGFLHCEIHSDADARPGSEGEIRKTANSFTLAGEKSARVENERLVPQQPMAMNEPWRNDDDAAGRNFAITQNIIQDSRAA